MNLKNANVPLLQTKSDSTATNLAKENETTSDTAAVTHIHPFSTREFGNNSSQEGKLCKSPDKYVAFARWLSSVKTLDEAKMSVQFVSVGQSTVVENSEYEFGCGKS